MKRIKKIIQVAVTFLGIPIMAVGQDYLDHSFGNVGIAVTTFGTGNSGGSAVAIQSDGKIVVGGSEASDIALARYNTDGSPDSTFGTAGIVTANLGASEGIADIAIQADGKIVMIGTYSYNPTGTGPLFPTILIFVARYNANGTPDNTFGTNGISWYGGGAATHMASSLVIQNDGKIVGSGSKWSSSTFQNQLIVFRMNSDGTLDTSFGNSGLFTAGFAATTSHGRSIALQNDGKIVVTGGLIYASTTDLLLIRLTANGTLDAGFGTGGLVHIDWTADDEGTVVLLQNDGKIVAAGTASSTTTPDTSYSVLLRLLTDGTPDNTFGANGLVTTLQQTSSGFIFRASSAVIQNDGRIVLAGSATTGATEFALYRFESDGMPDSTFDVDGIVTTALGGNAYMNDIAVQADGKFVGTGRGYWAGTTSSFTTVRYGDNLVSQKEIPSAAGIVVYPNPAADKLFIRSDHLGIEQIEISNMMGVSTDIRLSASQKNGINELDLSSLPPGIYFIKIVAGKGAQIRKIIRR